ncbi:hypothetical protein SUGI_0559340 [Cryptomeria japonica]|nr:hypothetical protein SUGI_0559340 [Cryptomeria japonica]
MAHPRESCPLTAPHLLLANACSAKACNLCNPKLELELKLELLLCDAALTSSPYSSSFLAEVVVKLFGRVVVEETLATNPLVIGFCCLFVQTSHIKILGFAKVWQWRRRLQYIAK